MRKWVAGPANELSDNGMARGFGKVILLGEHAAVYGHPVLAGAINRTVELALCDGPTQVAGWNISVDVLDMNQTHPVAAAIRAVARALSVAPANMSGVATVPMSAGLGSSAALAVAVARVLAPERNDDEIALAANAAELLFHARPSGVDVALATRGGLGVFTSSGGLVPLVAPPIQVAIGLSGEARATSAMVAKVAAATGERANDPRLVALAREVSIGAAALAKGEVSVLGAAMNRAHDTHAELGLSTPKLDRLRAEALAAGAFGAKLTGAGGGGAVVAVGPNPTQILTAWQRAGYEGFVTMLGATR